MDASVIIPSYNSRCTITRCLKAILEQKTQFSYEVLVVDSSEDGTGELIAARFPEIKLIRFPNRRLPGLARNVGIELAQSEILAFTDSDCIPEPQWLDRMIREQAKGQCAAVGGAVLNSLIWNPIAWTGYLLEFSERLPSFPRRFVEILPTCNVSFHRSIFRRYGFFPTDLWPSEDQLFSLRLTRAGERLLFDPEIRVRHIFRHRLGALLKHQVRLGKASAMARKLDNLPHAWLADHPLRWFVPLARAMVLEARLVRWDIRNFLRFNLLLPLCLAGLIAWGIGFGRSEH